MAPQPVQDHVMGGLRPGAGPVRKSSGELDEERKQELIMEKKLRACRVNILAKSRSIFEQPLAILPPPPKKVPPPTISVESVRKATNPIALRYWNQCSNMGADQETPVTVVHTSPGDDSPPWVTSTPLAAPPCRDPPKLPPKKVSVPNITHRMGRAESMDRLQVTGSRTRVQSLDRLGSSPAHDDPSPMGSPRTPVPQDPAPWGSNSSNTVLSTAGQGVTRDNQKKEAVGNINRLFSMNKMKKDDSVRVAASQNRVVEVSDRQNTNIEESRSYKQLKEEQIQKSQQRADFMGASEKIRIPKSPRPFRDSTPKLEEPRRTPVLQDEAIQCSCRHAKKFSHSEIPFNTITDLIPKLNQQQATHIGLTLFSQMPQQTVLEVVAQQLSVMSGATMVKVFAGLQKEALNTALPLLFPVTNDDVRMSVLVDYLPRLSTKQKVDLLAESEGEVPAIVSGLTERLGYQDRRVLVQRLAGGELKTSIRATPGAGPEGGGGPPGGRVIPQIRLADCEGGEEDWAWEQEEELEYEFYEQEEGAISN